VDQFRFTCSYLRKLISLYRMDFDGAGATIEVIWSEDHQAGREGKSLHFRVCWGRFTYSFPWNVSYLGRFALVSRFILTCYPCLLVKVVHPPIGWPQCFREGFWEIWTYLKSCRGIPSRNLPGRLKKVATFETIVYEARGEHVNRGFCDAYDWLQGFPSGFDSPRVRRVSAPCGGEGRKIEIPRAGDSAINRLRGYEFGYTPGLNVPYFHRSAWWTLPLLWFVAWSSSVGFLGQGNLYIGIF